MMKKTCLITLSIAAGLTFKAPAQDTHQISTIVVPGSIPQVFMQEGVDTPNNESALTLSPDGHTVYLADNYVIKISWKSDGKWTKPVVAPFSGKWHDWDPTLSPDGKRLIFVSNRPIDGADQTIAHKSHHLWYTDHLSGDTWSTPKRIDSPVNMEGYNDYGPSISASGTICFCSRNREGDKKMCAYYAKWLGDHYDKPRLLALNGTSDVYDPFIAPDEHYIIFSSDNNLYISFRQGDRWSPAQDLGPQINKGNWSGDPYVSPDGKTLYYAQDKAPGLMMMPVAIPGS
jgi:Tol biopolymer transport system component